jgi:predicted O-linked N-acetylglucosamine transferase (SPINDLY family)
MISHIDESHDISPNEFDNTLEDIGLKLNIWIAAPQTEYQFCLIHKKFIVAYTRLKQDLFYASDSPSSKTTLFNHLEKGLISQIKKVFTEVSSSNLASLPHHPSKLTQDPNYFKQLLFLGESTGYLLRILNNQEKLANVMQDLMIAQSISSFQQNSSLNTLIQENQDLKITLDTLLEEQKNSSKKQKVFFDSIEEKERIILN